MQLEKQKLLLQYLISSSDTYAICKSIIKSEYFDPKYRRTIDFIQEYYDKYNALPRPEQIEAETSIKIKTEPVTRDQIAYCSTEIETFCRRKALEKAILESPALIDKGDYGKVEQIIKEAIQISLNKNIGINYFENPLERLEKQLESAKRVSTGWSDFDAALDGGLARTEMLLFTANSGGGKSIVLTNLGINFLIQKLNVLYISLELSEEMIARRCDTMFTGIPTILWQQNYKRIASELSQISPYYGKLTIKHMPSGTNANDIRSYLKEFELTNNYIPDLLIVDYLDIMGANEKVSADNVWEKDKRAAEQLRDIGFEYNLFIATASQQNRRALETDEIHQGHIAGGITKINTVDWAVSILFSPAMKASGEIGFSFIKTRSSDSVGKTIFLNWDNKHLRVINPINKENVDADGVIVDKMSKKKENASTHKKSLLDVMDPS